MNLEICSSESGFLQASQEDLASPAEGELGAVQRHHREGRDYSAKGLEVVRTYFQLSQNQYSIIDSCAGDVQGGRGGGGGGAW